MTRIVSATVAVAVACLQIGCATSKYAANGRLLGEPVETTVDSPEAAYYLSTYLAGRRTNPALDARIDRLHATAPTDRLPTRPELFAVAREFSTDFAAIFFADRVARNSANVRLHSLFKHYLENPDDGRDTLERSYECYVVLFAPGWDYRANGHVTGADFARPRKLVSQLGIENHLIEFDPHGSVEANSQAILGAIEAASGSGKRVILVGASSAGPAIHLALDDVGRRGLPTPAAWINLGGILQGSPLVERIERFPVSLFFNAYVWAKGWDKSAVESMSATHSRARFARLSLPAEMLVINYVGLSLSGSLSRFAKDKYPTLKSEGPNDGLTPLTDIIAPHSLTLIAPSSDHFFAEDPLIDQKTVALAKSVITLLDASISRHPKNAAPATAQPSTASNGDTRKNSSPPCVASMSAGHLASVIAGGGG